MRIPRPTPARDPGALGLPFREVVIPGEMPLSAWVVEAPAPKGLALVLHGYSASRDQLLETARLLHERGWSSVLPDFYGSGGSGGSGTTLGWREARDVVQAAPALWRAGVGAFLDGLAIPEAAPAE